MKRYISYSSTKVWFYYANWRLLFKTLSMRNHNLLCGEIQTQRSILFGVLPISAEAFLNLYYVENANMMSLFMEMLIQQFSFSINCETVNFFAGIKSNCLKILCPPPSVIRNLGCMVCCCMCCLGLASLTLDITFKLLDQELWCFTCVYLVGRTFQIYSKPCVQRPLKNRQNKDLNDSW